MSTIGKTRKQNLRRLIDERYEGVVQRLATDLEVPHNSLWRLLSNKDSANARSMGEKMARKIERACGLHVGWMDQAITTQTSEESAALAERILSLPEADRDAVLRMVKALSSDDAAL